MLKTLIERDRGIASGCRGQYALEPVIRDASEVKFIFADSLDVVDPNYDFTTEQAAESRAHWDKCYPHELMEPAPYDGVLVSRGIVDGKYSSAQALRLRRNGVRKFLRLDGPRFAHMPIYGDSGAFRYCSHDKPPYTAAQMLDFYADGGFTHGCSVDHIVFDFDREESGRAAGSDSARSRSGITLENARTFLEQSKALGIGFTPIGVVQGWSPSSIGNAAADLEKMGYSYIALGGLVPLRSVDIHRCLSAVRERISPRTRIHLSNFSRVEEIGDFARYGIESFDSSSPLLHAFMHARFNYYVLNGVGLDYYATIRIPSTLENTRLIRAANQGQLEQETLLELERQALEAVRGYDRHGVTLEDAVERVADYGSLLADDPSTGSPSREKLRDAIRVDAERTLRERPWSTCPCEICQVASVDVAIFRSSERNKRRGFHNLGVFFRHVRRLRDGGG